MSTPFDMGRDINGFNAFAPIYSDTVYQTTLSANIEQHFTVPGSKIGQFQNYIAVFSFDPGLRIFFANNVMAVIPGILFAAGPGELNPTTRYVKAGDILSFITPDTTAYVTVALYVIQ